VMSRKGEKFDPVVVLHLASVIPATVIGTVVLFNKKGGSLLSSKTHVTRKQLLKLNFTYTGTSSHKFLGRMWVGLMASTSITSYFINEARPGKYSGIHGLSTFTLFSLVGGK